MKGGACFSVGVDRLVSQLHAHVIGAFCVFKGHPSVSPLNHTSSISFLH